MRRSMTSVGVCFVEIFSVKAFGQRMIVAGIIEYKKCWSAAMSVCARDALSNSPNIDLLGDDAPAGSIFIVGGVDDMQIMNVLLNEAL